MDDTQFSAQYGFDIDMMKRPIEGSSANPDAKKARWSPTANPGSVADPFPNYGYGSSSPSGSAVAAAAGGNAAIYSTPNLSINTSAPVQAGLPSPASAAFGPGGGTSPINGTNAAAYAQAANLAAQYNLMMNGYAGAAAAQQMNSPVGGRLPQLNISMAQASYGGAPFSAGLNTGGMFSAGGMTPVSATNNRTVYLGNLGPDGALDELLHLVHFGPIENIRVLPDKNCVFISFLDPLTAQQFYSDAMLRKISLHGQEIKVGWGKPSAVPNNVMMAVTQNGASRNVYLGGLDDQMMDEHWIRNELTRFGPIDQVKVVKDKNIAFVHFLSISTAMKVVQTLPNEPNWQGKRVNYGKDRCAYVPKSQQAAAHAAQANAAQEFIRSMGGLPSAGLPSGGLSPGGAFSAGLPNINTNGLASPATATAPNGGLTSPTSAFGSGYSPFGSSSGMNSAGLQSAGLASAGMMELGMQQAMMAAALNGMAANNGALAAMGNRTVYLGNIHPETTTEDLCNSIRGGILQSIRYMQDKHIAFVTFTDANSAMTFFQLASYQGLTLNSRRLKIGWGKNSGPLTPQLALAVHAGATRNVYIGNIEDFEVFNEERLRRDFGEFGEVELVNYLREKNCAFVNFTNISNAIKAIEAIKVKPEYANLRIAHGKDRCANPPRSGPQGSSGKRGGGATAMGGAGGAGGEEGQELLDDGGVEVDVGALQDAVEAESGEMVVDEGLA